MPRRGRPSEPGLCSPVVIALVLLTSVIVVRFPTLFGDDAPLWASVLPAVVLGVPVTLLIVRRPRLKARPGELMLGAAYAALVLISFPRAARADAVLTAQTALSVTVVTAMVLALGVLALLSDPCPAERRRRWLAAALAPTAYVAVNVVLHLAGFAAATTVDAAEQTGRSAQVLGLIGFASERVRFPMASGINNFGAIAGLALATSAMIAIRARGPLRWWAVSGCAVSFYGLLAVDSRGGLLLSLTAVAVVWLLPRVAERGVKGLPILLPMAPAIILGVLGVLSGTALADALSRDGGDFSSATGRGEVWATVVGYLAHPHLADLWGYGAYGQLTSEVSFSYASVLVGYSRPEFATAHNFALQSVLEVGYIGAALGLALLFYCVKRTAERHARSPSPEEGAIFAGILFVVLIGMVEAVPTISYPDTFAAFALLAPACLRLAPTAPT